jgi:hypothetical protein
LIEIRPEMRDTAALCAQARGFSETRDMLSYYEKRNRQGKSERQTDDDRRILLTMLQAKEL